MLKSSSLLLISLALLLLSLESASSFLNNIHSSGVEKNTGRAPGKDMCCLPMVHSMKQSMRQVFSFNGSLTLIQANINTVADYKNGKLRIDTIIDSKMTSKWNFKISDNTTIEYDFLEGQCKCKKIIPNFNPYCFNLVNSHFSKVKIGGLDGVKLTDSKAGINAETVLIREPGWLYQTCWMLSSSVFDSSASSELLFYDMVEKVDENAFKIPPTCPPIESCMQK